VLRPREMLLGIIVAVAAVAAGCATDRLHQEGLQAIDAGQYEDGIEKLEQAVAASPSNLTYRLDLQGRREQAIQRLLGEGDQARVSGQLEQAEQVYTRVLGIDPGNVRAEDRLAAVKDDRRHAAVIEAATRDLEQGNLDQAETRVREVLKENPGSKAANGLRGQIDAARGPRNAGPSLRTDSARLVALQFRDASTKMVFEVLARQTGVNFIFDKDIKSDGKTTIFVQGVPVEQAIDLILRQNSLGQQVLADNMVLIYPNTPAKQKEYQSQIVRTFYLTNTAPKVAMDMLKTVLDASTLFMDERAGAVIMRDTPERVRMAERLLASVDVPEAEVMLEVEVIELTRSKLEQLGIKYPSQLTMSPTPEGKKLVLSDLKKQNSDTIQISPISVTVDLKKEVGTSNLLASPRIRARNREKAKILIGERVPVITNTVTPTASSPVVTGTVQYLDVGLTLEVQPEIYNDSDVAIKVDLEVSNIVRAIESAQSGTLAYQIGTRNASTLLQLKDGETQVLAGLIQDTDRRNSNHIPGLGDVPILGRLFGTQSDDAVKTEIVLSITPRIIRAQARASSDNVEFFYGTDSDPRGLPFAASTAGVKPVAWSGGRNKASAAPTAVQTPPVAAAGEVDEPANAGASEEAAPEADLAVLKLDGPGQVSVGQDFDVVVRLSNAQSISDITSLLRFEPGVLSFIGGAAADLVPAGPRQLEDPRIDQREAPGRVRFDVNNTSISGDGELYVVRFKALRAQPRTVINMQQFKATGPDGEQAGVTAPRPLIVVVAP
jgi:general secretion pathway protein D